MNTIYNVVWNSTTGTWVVASEMAKGRKKKSKAASAATAAMLVTATGLGAGTALMPGDAMAMPGFCASSWNGYNNYSASNLGSGGVHGGCLAAEPGGSGGVLDYRDVVLSVNNLAFISASVFPSNKTATMWLSGDDGTINFDIGSQYGQIIKINSNGRMNGLSDGVIAAGSTDAITGNQAFALQSKIEQITGGGAGGGKAKYFNANSSGADSSATGGDAIAIGPVAKASGAASIAVGLNAKAQGQNTAAIGANTNAGDYSVAIGDGADTYATAWAVGVGMNSKVTGSNGVAVGYAAQATAANAAAIGANSIADRANSLSVGKVGAERQVVNVARGTAGTDAVNVDQLKGVTNALGGGATVNGDGSIKGPGYKVAGGSYSNVGDALAAIDGKSVGGTSKYFHANSSGADSSATGGESIAIGPVAKAAGYNSVAVGNSAAANGTSGIAIGSAASAGADWTFAAGNASIAKSSGDVSLGASSQADGAGQWATAVGTQAQATATQSTAVGAGAKATHHYSVALGQNSTTDRINSVSVGNATWQRQVTFVAKGTADTDAVNVSQLKGVTAAIGGDTTVNADGSISKAGISVDGTKYDTVAKAIDAVNAKTGGTGKYFHANSTGADSSATGADSIAIGPVAKAAGEASIAVGLNANAAGGDTAVIGADAKAGDYSVAIGSFADTYSTAWAVGVGMNSKVTGKNGVAVGYAAQATAENAAAIGANSLADRANSLSVGKVGAERQIINVNKGTAATDAVNVSQLKGVTAAIGGDTTVNADGSISKAGISVDGKKYDTVAEAIAAVNAKPSSNKYFHTNTTLADSTTTGADSIAIGGNAASDGKWSLAAGTNAKATGDNSVALGNSSLADRANSVSVGNATTQRQITNLAKGTQGTDAVNVDQLKSAGFTLDTAGNVTNAAVTYKAGSIASGSPVVVLEKGQGDSKYFVDGDRTKGKLPKGTVIGNVADGTQDTDAANIGSVYNIVAQQTGNGGTSRGLLVPLAAGVGSGVDTTGLTASYKTAAYYSQVAGRGDSAGSTPPSDVARASGAGSIAVGSNAFANATSSTAVGVQSHTTLAATDAVALGSGSVATEANTVSLGSDGKTSYTAYDAAGKAYTVTNQANTRRLVNMAAGKADTDGVNVSQLKGVTAAIGGGSVVNTDGSVKAPDFVVGGSTVHTVGEAITNIDGRVTNVTNTVNTITNGGGVKYFHVNSTGADSAATGGDSVAIGASAKAAGAAAIAVGQNATTTGNNNIAIGGDSKAADKAVSIGNGVDTSTQSWAVGLGTNAKVTGSLGVALGAGTQVTGANAAAIGANSIADRANSVSVGSAATQRQVINVAKGTADNDAVNVSQLKGVTTALGGSAGLNSDGSVKAPSYTIQGQKDIADVGTALGKLDTATTANTTAINNITNGGGVKYFHVNSTGADSAATGTESVAIGSSAKAAGTNSIALGLNAAATGQSTTTIGAASKAGDYSVAIGDGADTFATAWAVGVGMNSKVTGKNGVAVGYAAQATAENAVAVGANSLADRANSLSVGKVGAERQVVNVAKGTVGTDAVNVDQLKGVTTAIGGGATVKADGSIDPGFTIGGTKYASVAEAVAAVDAKAGAASPLAVSYDDSTKAKVTLNKGGAGAVTIANVKAGVANDEAVNVGQLKASGIIDAGGNVKKAVLFDGPNGEANVANQKIINVTAGTVGASSKDAINGAQLYGTANSVATALGGSSTVNADGTVKAPEYTVAGAKVTGVGSAIDALSTANGQNTTNITNVLSGKAGLVQQAGAGQKLTVGKDTDGTEVDMSSKTTQRQLTGVAKGLTDNAALTVAQAKSAGFTFDGTGNVTNPAVTYKAGSIASGSPVVVLDKGTGDSPFFVDGDRTKGKLPKGTVISNVANGVQDTDAANLGTVYDIVGQLGANGRSSRTLVPLAAGVGSGVDTTGLTLSYKTAAYYSQVAGKGDSSGSTAPSDVARASGAGSIAVGSNAFANGNSSTAVGVQSHTTLAASDAVALGSGSVATEANTVSLGSDGKTSYTAYDVTGKAYTIQNQANTRRLVNLAAGTADTDGVNVSQLKGVTAAIGGGTSVNADGTIKPGITVGGHDYTTVADAISAVDAKAGTGSALGVSYDDTTKTKVTLNKGGTTGPVTIANVKAGVSDNEAINVAQLKATGLIDPTGKTLDAVVYDANSNKGSVSFGGASGTVLKNVAAGTVSSTSKEGINGSQLFGASQSVAGIIGGGATVDKDGKVTQPTFVVDGKDTHSVGDAIGAVEALAKTGSSLGVAYDDSTKTKVTLNKGGTTGPVTIANVKAGVGDDEAINVAQLKATGLIDPTGKALDAVVYDANSNKGSVSFGGASGTVLKNVAAGTVSLTSKEGINGSQLFATAKSVADALGGSAEVNPDGTVKKPAIKIDNTDYTVADAIKAVDAKVGTGSALGVAYDDATKASVTLNNGGAPVKLGNVKNGVAQNDAVNFGQLKPVIDGLGGGAKVDPTTGVVTGPTYNITKIDGTTTTVNNAGDAITNIDGRVTNVIEGKVGLVQQEAAGANLTVGKDTDGVAVDFTAKGGKTRQLKGVAAGSADSDAVNVKQFKDAGLIDPTGKALDAVVYDANSNKGSVSFGGASGTVLKNVAAGTVSLTSKEGINGSQLFATAKSVADALGGSAEVNTDGTVKKPVIKIDNNDYSVADAIKAVDAKVGTGSALGVAYDDATKASVTLNNGGAPVKLGNVKNGVAQNDAVNFGQLKPVIDGLGGGAKVDPTTGVVTGPTYNITKIDGTTTTVHTVGDAITNIDARTTQNTNNITNVLSGKAGLVQQAAAGEKLTVGKDTDGTEVSFASKTGDRKLSGVAKGTADNDAVNVKQLKDAGLVDGKGNVANAVVYDSDAKDSVTLGNTGKPVTLKNVANGTKDDEAINFGQFKSAGLVDTDGKALDAVVYDAGSNKASVTFGGANGTLLKNVADGRIGAGSREAINGGQIAAIKDALEGKITNIDNRVTKIEGNTVGGGTPGFISANGVGGSPKPADAGNTPGVALGFDSSASGSGASVIGDHAKAEGFDSVAIGNNASTTATGANSVALGNGSTADRANTVSVGSEGHERTISNVARGNADTDAVNVGLLEERVRDVGSAANAYTDKLVNDVWSNISEEIDHSNRQANRGIAAASALINVTPYVPGHVTVNAGVAGYRGESALGVGVSRWSENGRVNLNAGVSAAQGDEAIFRVGVGYIF